MAQRLVLLTATQFAKELGVSRQYVARQCRTGLLKAERQGGVWLIPRGQLSLQRARRARLDKQRNHAA